MEDAEDAPPCRRRGDPGPSEALCAPDRRRTPADTRRGARARPSQGRGRRGGEAKADRVQSPARDVDHPQLHEGRCAAPRPDPGGQSRPDPRRREVRLQDGLQALDLRHVVDSPVRHAGARRAGPDDPPARARRRAGAPRHPQPPHPRPEAEPRPERNRDCDRGGLHARARPGAARARPGPGQPRDARRRRREPLRRHGRGHEDRRARRRDVRPAPRQRALSSTRPPESAHAPRPRPALRPGRCDPADAGRGRSRPRHHPRARPPARVARPARAAHGRTRARVLPPRS